MSALSQIQNATITGGGNNIRDGRYRLLVESFTYAKGFRGERVVAECRVIDSIASDEVDKAGKPVIPNAVGSSFSLLCMLKEGDTTGASEAKAFLLAAIAPLGQDAAFLTEDNIFNVLAGPNNPLRGIAMGCVTYRKVNQGTRNPANKGVAMTLPKWQSMEQTVEDIKAQRVWLDTNGAKAEAATPAPVSPAVAAFVAAPVVTPIVATPTAPTASPTAPTAPTASPTAPTAPTASPASSRLLSSLGLGGK